MNPPVVVVPKVNRFLTHTGTFTLIQALFQFVFALIGVVQHFCVINFLRHFPLLIYIKLLYYHNPSRCGSDVLIGEVIDALPDQAFIYAPTMPETTSRTLIITSVSLSLSVLWVVGSILLIKGGYRQHFTNHIHWPWVVVTFTVTLVDIIAACLYINDTFYTGCPERLRDAFDFPGIPSSDPDLVTMESPQEYTKKDTTNGLNTLQKIIAHVSGTASGMGNYDTNTAWASWTMVLLFSRFGVVLAINTALAVFTVLDCTRFRTSITSSEIERMQYQITDGNGLNNGHEDSNGSNKQAEESENSSTPSTVVPKIPRPGLSASFRSMKDFLLETTRNSLTRSRNRVNFQPEPSPEPPHTATFENLIAEQQRRLRTVAVDTSGRSALPASRSLPHLLNNPEPSDPRRNTAGRLANQMPWAYIAGAPANRMRDQLPPDEDLPPVPLPDYTAIQSARKASVHRAASSLSSLTQPKEYSNSKSSHPVSSSLVDVLY